VFKIARFYKVLYFVLIFFFFHFRFYVGSTRIFYSAGLRHLFVIYDQPSLLQLNATQLLNNLDCFTLRSKFLFLVTCCVKRNFVYITSFSLPVSQDFVFVTKLLFHKTKFVALWHHSNVIKFCFRNNYLFHKTKFCYKQKLLLL